MRRTGIYTLLFLLSAGIGLAVAWPVVEDPFPDRGPDPSESAAAAAAGPAALPSLTDAAGRVTAAPRR